MKNRDFRDFRLFRTIQNCLRIRVLEKRRGLIIAARLYSKNSMPGLSGRRV